MKKIKTAFTIIGEFVALSIGRVASLYETSQHLVVGILTVIIVLVFLALAFKSRDTSSNRDQETIYNLSQALERTSFKAYIK